MSDNQKIIHSGFKKDNVSIFLQNNKSFNQDIPVSTIYKAMIDLCAIKLNRKRIKIKIKTSSYVGNLLKRNKLNINFILISAILNLALDNDLNSKIDEIQEYCNFDLVKLVNKDIWNLLSSFLATDYQNIMTLKIGALLHYYYLVKK